MMKRVLGCVAMVLALSATAAWAVHTFSDVPDDRPHADDIAYSVEQGWFQGYSNGTFKPDRALSTNQALTVFGRAFPDGVSRADLATILRSGEAALTTTTTAAPSEAEPCAQQMGVDMTATSSTGLELPTRGAKFRPGQACPDSWYMQPYMLDSNDRLIGDWGNEARSRRSGS